jgi:hypothetical protein
MQAAFEENLMNDRMIICLFYNVAKDEERYFHIGDISFDT